MQRFPMTNPGIASGVSQNANEVAAEQLASQLTSPTNTGVGLDLGNLHTHVSAGLPMLFILVIGLGLAYMLFKGRLGLSATLSGRVGE